MLSYCEIPKGHVLNIRQKMFLHKSQKNDEKADGNNNRKNLGIIMCAFRHYLAKSRHYYVCLMCAFCICSLYITGRGGSPVGCRPGVPPHSPIL